MEVASSFKHESLLLLTYLQFKERWFTSPNENRISRWIEGWFVGVKDEAIKDRGFEQIRTTTYFQSQLVSSLEEIGRRGETEIERNWCS